MKKLANTGNTLAIALLLALFTGLQPALAQVGIDPNIESRNKAQLEKLNRKNLREAKKYQSDYKETHLNTGTYQYKPGKAGRKALKDKKKARKDERKMKASKLK